MDKRPLLSICIPTYNRISMLKEVLQHFLENPEFDDDIELIISDNASTDNTENICREIAEQHTNIFYYRNEENICDKNFVQALNYGKGEYLKLLNDWCYMDTEGLRFVKKVIRENMGDRTPLFFSNNWIFTDVKKPVMKCNSVDEYMQVVSTYVTSNNIFGAWLNDWQMIHDKIRYAHLKLQQVDWSYQIVSMHQKCIIYDETILKFADVSKRNNSGYNWFQVHLDNYYKIILPYVLSGQISSSTFKQDRKYLLQHFTRELRRAFGLSRRRGWNYDTKGTLSILFKYYYKDLYFYYFILTLMWQKRIQLKHHRF